MISLMLISMLFDGNDDDDNGFDGIIVHIVAKYIVCIFESALV